MSKIVVTGGAGFIGSHLVDALIEKGNNVVVVDNLSTGNKSYIHPKATFKQIDIRNLSELKKAMEGIDYVYHLAALPRIQRSIQNPCETNDVNIGGTLNVLEAAHINDINRVIFTSSSSVYGNQEKFPLTEKMIPHPLSPYALQKLIGERYCELYSKLYGLKTVSLRLFSVYGSRQNGSEEFATVIGKFLYLKKNKKPLVIYGDGTRERDFTHIDDVVKALLLAMKMPLVEHSPINICTGKSYSVNKIAELIGGKRKYEKQRNGESENTRGSNRKARTLLHWKSTKDLKKELLQWGSTC